MHLMLYYRLNKSFQKHHDWSEDRINNIYPWERDIFIAFINEDINKEEMKNNG